jgi:hypothetical protein
MRKPWSAIDQICEHDQMLESMAQNRYLFVISKG